MQSYSQSKETLQREINDLEERVVAYITQGSSRKRLNNRVERKFRQIEDTDERRASAASFLRRVINRIHNQPTLSIMGSRMFLYHLWRTLEATSEDWGLLHRVPWYRTPTDEQLKLAEYRTGKLWVEGRCEELQEVAALMGKKIETTRRRRTALVSTDTEPDVGKHLVTIGKMGDSSRAVTSATTVGVQNRDSPPTKKSHGPSTSGTMYQSREERFSIRSIVIVPPQPSVNSIEMERMLRDRLVERMNVQSPVQMNPIENRSRNKSTEGEVMESVSRMEVEEGEVIERSNPEDHFCGPLNNKVIEEERKRNAGGIIKRKKCVPLYAIIDVEGQSPRLVEISVLLCSESELIEARIFHLKVSDEESMCEGARYSHGMAVSELAKLAKYTEKEALEEIRSWLESQKTFVTVLSADESENSDVSRLVRGWMVRYVAVSLPRWTERVLTKAYQEIQAYKPAVVRVLSAECPYKQLHRANLLSKKVRTAVTDGPHCSLLDCRHLYRHIELNHLWPMIKRLSTHSKMPHYLETECEEHVEQY
jgi:hypothetical protein